MKIIYLFALLWCSAGASNSLCVPGQQEVRVHQKFKICDDNVCSSLTDLIKHNINLENKCIVLENPKERLNRNLTARNLRNFAMVSLSGTDISCSNDVGLFFQDIKKLALRGGNGNISFTNCGRVLKVDDSKVVKVTLYFQNVGDTKLEKILCQSFQGHGIIVDELQNDFKASNITIKKNSLYCRENSFCNGGGLLMNFTETNGKKVNFENVEFSQLKSANPGNDPSTQNDRKAFEDISGKGSSIAIQLYENAENNIITFHKILLKDNYAEYGGSVAIFDTKELNKIEFYSLEINNSTSLFHGGGILYYSLSKNENPNNPFLCRDCTFTNCSTIYSFGGAVWIYRNDTLNKKYKNYTLQNTVFENNKGVSTDIFNFNSHLLILGKLRSTKFSDQTKVIIQNTKLYIHGNAEISNSLKGAINGEHSSIYIYGELTIANNIGTTGGGISIYGRSSIQLGRKAVLLVHGNKANLGSGLFASITATNHLLRCECLFEFVDHDPLAFEGQVLFRNNTNNDLFVSTQRCCKVKIEEIPNFQLLSAVPLITNPIRIETNRESWEHLYPGERKKHNISLVDDFGQMVDGSIDITVRVKDKYTADNKKTYYIYANVPTMVVIDGIAPGMEYLLIFSFTYNFSTALTFENLKAKPCPMFLMLQNKKCVCESNRLLEEKLGGVYCLNGEVFFAERHWTVEGVMNKTHNERKSSSLDYKGNVFHCPYGYCDTCKHTSCLYRPHHQCSKNRKQDSRLCSQCVEQAYVNPAGDCILRPSCLNVSIRTYYYTITIILAIFTWLFIYLIICPLLAKSAGDYLLPVVYFYIIVPYLLRGVRFVSNNHNNAEEGNTFEEGNANEEEIIKASTMFVKLIYLWPSYIMCSSQINRLHMESLNFICGALVPLLSSRILLWSWFQRKISNREIDLKRWVIVIGFIIFHNTLNFSVNILHFVSIEEKEYFYIYATETSTWYYILIVSILIIIIIYIILAIFFTTAWSYFKLHKCDCISKCLRKYSDCQICSCCQIFPQQLKRTLSYLQSGFENNKERDCTWFSLAYIAFIVSANCVVVYMADEMVQTTVLTLFVLIFLVIYAHVRPYTNTKTNFFEMFILGILIVVGVTVDASKGSYYFNYNLLLRFLIALLFIPIGLSMLYLTYKLYKFLVWYFSKNGKNSNADNKRCCGISLGKIISWCPTCCSGGINYFSNIF